MFGSLRAYKAATAIFIFILLLGVVGNVGAKEIVIWAGADLIAGSDELAKEIKARFPHIDPVIQPMSTDDVHAKLLAHIAAGMAPDVVAINEANVTSFASQGALLPLDDYLAGDPDTDPSNWVPMVYKTSVVEGKLYALPVTTDVRGLFWNKTMFSNAGLDPNAPPQTWSELMEYAKRLTRTDGSGKLTQVGFRALESQGSLYFYAHLNGAEFLSADGRKALLDTPEVLGALEYVNSLYEFLGGYQTATSFGSGDRFLNQQVAMRVNGNWRLNTKAADPRAESVDWAVSWVPVPDDRYNQVGRFKGMSQFSTWSAGWRWTIPAASKNHDDAWQVLKFLSSVDGHLANARGEFLKKKADGQMYVPRITANINADRRLANEYFQTLPARYLEAQWFFIGMLEVTAHRPNHPLQGELVSTLSSIQNTSTRDGVHPMEALQNAQRKLQASIDEYFARQ
jgi:multiple sugar transport system substrate-binding protein